MRLKWRPQCINYHADAVYRSLPIKKKARCTILIDVTPEETDEMPRETLLIDDEDEVFSPSNVNSIGDDDDDGCDSSISSDKTARTTNCKEVVMEDFEDIQEKETETVKFQNDSSQQDGIPYDPEIEPCTKAPQECSPEQLFQDAIQETPDISSQGKSEIPVREVVCANTKVSFQKKRKRIENSRNIEMSSKTSFRNSSTGSSHILIRQRDQILWNLHFSKRRKCLPSAPYVLVPLIAIQFVEELLYCYKHQEQKITRTGRSACLAHVLDGVGYQHENVIPSLVTAYNSPKTKFLSASKQKHVGNTFDSSSDNITSTYHTPQKNVQPNFLREPDSLLNRKYDIETVKIDVPEEARPRFYTYPEQAGEDLQTKSEGTKESYDINKNSNLKAISSRTQNNLQAELDRECYAYKSRNEAEHVQAINLSQGDEDNISREPDLKVTIENSAAEDGSEHEEIVVDSFNGSSDELDNETGQISGVMNSQNEEPIKQQNGNPLNYVHGLGFNQPEYDVSPHRHIDAHQNQEVTEQLKSSQLESSPKLVNQISAKKSSTEDRMKANGQELSNGRREKRKKSKKKDKKPGGTGVVSNEQQRKHKKKLKKEKKREKKEKKRLEKRKRKSDHDHMGYQSSKKRRSTLQNDFKCLKPPRVTPNITQKPPLKTQANTPSIPANYQDGYDSPFPINDDDHDDASSHEPLPIETPTVQPSSVNQGNSKSTILQPLTTDDGSYNTTRKRTRPQSMLAKLASEAEPNSHLEEVIPEIHPISLYCSEEFIEVFGVTATSLATGEYRSSLLLSSGTVDSSHDNTHKLHLGRLPSITLQDTALLEYVSIELAQKKAIKVVNVSELQQTTIKDVLVNFVRLVASSRYKSIAFMLCLDKDIDQNTSNLIAALQNAYVSRPGETFVTFQMVPSSLLGAFISHHILSNQRGNRALSPVIDRGINEPTVQGKIHFLSSIAPTLSLCGAIQILRLCSACTDSNMNLTEQHATEGLRKAFGNQQALRNCLSFMLDDKGSEIRQENITQIISASYARWNVE